VLSIYNLYLSLRAIYSFQLSEDYLGRGVWIMGELGIGDSVDWFWFMGISERSKKSEVPLFS
jgi:hypothetical protein